MTQVTLPHRAAIVDLLTSQTRALHAREIAARLHVEDASYPGLLRLLDHLVFNGEISPQSGKRFQAKREPRVVRGSERQGVLTVHPRGFGFVASVGHDDDLYIPEEAMGGGMHGDLVTAQLVGRTQRGSEGSIVAVLKRGNPRIVGVLRRKGKG